MSGQCKCGSRAINDDPHSVLCDNCWRDAEIERLREERDVANRANTFLRGEEQRLRHELATAQLDLQIEKAYYTNTPYYYELLKKRDSTKTGGEG